MLYGGGERGAALTYSYLAVGLPYTRCLTSFRCFVAKAEFIGGRGLEQNRGNGISDLRPASEAQCPAVITVCLMI